MFISPETGKVMRGDICKGLTMKVGDKVIVITKRFRGQAGGVGRIIHAAGPEKDLRFSVNRKRDESLPGVGEGILTYGEQDLQVIEPAVDF